METPERSFKDLGHNMTTGFCTERDEKNKTLYQENVRNVSEGILQALLHPDFGFSLFLMPVHASLATIHG